MPLLIVREPGRVMVSLSLQENLSIGRHEENRLRFPYAEVSRHHAQIEQQEDGFHVHDLGSRTGTFVNGVRVTTALLRDGDTVRIGPALLTFTAGEARSIERSALCPTADEGALANEDPRLRILFEVSRTAFAEADPDESLARLLDAILRILRVERAIAALREDEPDRYRYICRSRDGANSPGDLRLSPATLEVLSSRRSIVLRDDRATQFSAMGAPLQVGARAIGFLYVEDCTRDTQFQQDDLDFMNAIACLTAAAIDSAERYQRAAAAEAAASGSGIFAEIVGESVAIRRMKEQIRRYAASSATPVLIHGESGTGKELVAKAIHAASPRAARPFVAINCAAIPEAMIEGELFGYEQGAFTGAHRRRKGRFVLAHRGTLFLDEIGELSPQAQAKVLRATQDGEVYLLGAEQPVRVDVRIVAATHRDLRTEVAAGRFREDLYYRLKVVEVKVPPLRERADDIMTLAQMFLDAMVLNLGKQTSGFSPAARAALMSYTWPGNVRELKNEIERAVLHADGSIVEAEDLDPSIFSIDQVGDVSGNGSSLSDVGINAREDAEKGQTPSLSRRYAALDEMERALVEEAVVAARGNLAEAARMLGITRIMLKRRADRYGLLTREG